MVPDGDRTVEPADEPVQPVVGADAEGHGGHVVDHALDGRQPFGVEAPRLGRPRSRDGRGSSAPESTDQTWSASPAHGCMARTGATGRPRKWPRCWGELVEVHVPALAEGVLDLPVVAEGRRSAPAAAHRCRRRGPRSATRRPSALRSVQAAIAVGEARRLPGGDDALLGVPANGHQGHAPSRGSTWLRPMNQPSIPGPVAIAPDLLEGGVEGDLQHAARTRGA